MSHQWFGNGAFMTASSFSSPLFLSNHIKGRPGKWMEMERRYMDRVKKQTKNPIRGLRKPLEADAWHGNHQYFNTRATSGFWVYNELRNGTRPGLNRALPALTVQMQKYILFNIILAREFELKTEFVVDWTLKHNGTGDSAISWGTIGHCIRQVAAFLRLVHTGNWDKGIDGNAIGHPTDMDKDDRVRELFEQAKGPLLSLIGLEGHNEFLAHSRHSFAKAKMSKEEAIREVNMQGTRMRRLKHGEPEQFPEIAFWVSQHGNDKILYDPKDYSAVAIHPSRPSTRVGNRFNHLQKYGKTIYANERLHYIDPSMWYLIENGVFRVNSSTQDAVELMAFDERLMDKGIVVCHHSLVGMSNGHYGSNLEEMPLDKYEIRNGAKPDGVIVDPTPPPTPEPPTPEPPPIELPNIDLSRLINILGILGIDLSDLGINPDDIAPFIQKVIRELQERGKQLDRIEKMLLDIKDGR